jgi:uncharacterized protein YndB with AHSA1/START domain
MSVKQQGTGGTIKKYEFSRVFDAPVEKLWWAWSDPEIFKVWWGPKGYTSNSVKTDFRVGGKYVWNMHSPDGKDFYSAGIFKEIVPLKKLVFTDSFSDSSGKVIPASAYGIPGNWPLELITTITFKEMDGKTKMTWKEPGVPEESLKDAQVGGQQTLDKLADAVK